MQKIIKILIFVFISTLTLCKTAESVEMPAEPSRENGCEKFTGRKWEQCIDNMFKQFEAIYNTAGSRTQVSKDRPVWYRNLVRYEWRYCWTENFCKTVVETRIEKPWWKEIGEPILMFGAGYGVAKLPFGLLF